MVNAVFRFQIGRMQCAVLADVSDPLTEADVSGIFPHDAERLLAIFRAWPAPLTFCVNILYVDTGTERILVDSGVGQTNPDSAGQLLANLRAAGLAPESITTVVITHFHLDHIGGLLDANGQAVFERARLVVPQLEYDWAMSESFLASMSPDRVQRLRQIFAVYADRLTVAPSEAELAPGICYVAAPGHTPGHSAVLLASQGQRLLHVADTLHHPIQLNALDAVPTFDVEPEPATATRRTTVERAVAEDLPVMGYHLPFPGIYGIRQAGPDREWVEAGWWSSQS